MPPFLIHSHGLSQHLALILVLFFLAWVPFLNIVFIWVFALSHWPVMKKGEQV